MTYADQFPDFDPATLPPIPSTWIDQSWKHELCPSWSVGSLRVWVNFLNSSAREVDGQPRFIITDEGTSDEVFSSDDWSAILDFLAAFKICMKWLSVLGAWFDPDLTAAEYHAEPQNADMNADYDADMKRFKTLANHDEAFFVAMVQSKLV